MEENAAKIENERQVTAEFKHFRLNDKITKIMNIEKMEVLCFK